MLKNFIPIKSGSYKNVEFISDTLPFVCSGNLTLFNCTCNTKLFVLGNIVCIKGSYFFIDTNKKIYAKNTNIEKHLSVFEGGYLSNVKANYVLSIGDIKVKDSEIEHLEIYSGCILDKGNNIINSKELKTKDIC